MNPWGTYCTRNSLRGDTARDRAKNNLMSRLDRQIPSTLSYQSVDIDGIPRDIVVLNSDNLNQKTLCSLPGEDIRHGALVEWQNNRWIVTERDANTEIYTKCIMLQCNYLLKWINADGEVIERWSVVEDGTRYLTGEYSDAFFVASRGDSRIAVTLQKDKETLALGRDCRFIIDDYESPTPLAYRLTKPFKLGRSFDENGVVVYVMTECNSEGDDNLDLHIADYYKYFPRDDETLDDGLLGPNDELVETLTEAEDDSARVERQGWI